MKTPPRLIPAMQQLVAQPSVSSVNPAFDQSNQGVIGLLHDWFSDLGFSCEVFEVPGHPGKFNLIASAGRGPEGLVLSGHTDTVPFDDNRWSASPFKLQQKDNRLYGLGSCDMKGFFAFILEALQGIDLKKLQKPLMIVATADEESSMCGARALKPYLQGLGRHCVIGEPTALKPVRMHKGILMEGIRLTGQSGHSSNPSLGNSALEGMHEVISEILSWRRQLQQRHQHPGFAVQVPTLNLGHIHGGDNPNRICAECELHIDLRPLPGMPLQQLREELATRLEHRLSDSGLRLELFPLFDGIEAMETPAQAAIVQAAEQLTGHTAEAVAFATEAPYFNAMQMQSIILGPGSIDQAHQPDEYMALDQLNPGVDILRRLIRQFCF